MLRILLWLLALLAFTTGAALSYYNWADVRFDYLVGAAEVPLIGLLLASFVAGGITVSLISAIRVWSLRFELRRTQKRLRDAETELRNLRELPIAPGATPAALPPALPRTGTNAR
ncbi:MAG TPA: LapA family protein [Candidatus Binatia bacterium]|nr:LapA family protein [Candidatus Binatia bacterium]